MNVGAALTRKIGPLPAWGWGVALGGTLLAVKMLRGRTSAEQGSGPQLIAVPTGSPAQGLAGNDFISDLGNQLDEVRDAVDEQNEQQNADWFDLFEDWTDAFNKRFDDIAEMINTPTPPPTNTPTPPPPAPTPPPSVTPSTPPPAAPAPSRLTVAQAQAALAAIGAPTSWATSGAWIQSSAANYVWNSVESMQAWARRVARNEPSRGYAVDASGRIVRR